MRAKKSSFYILVFFLIQMTNVLPQAGIQELNLMPIPFKIEFTGEKFRINKQFSISINKDDPARTRPAAESMMQRLSLRTGLFFAHPSEAIGINSDTSLMTIIFTRKGEVKLGEDESYYLNITGKKIELIAETDIGIIRGVETLLQLLNSDENGYYFPSVIIEDKPRFKWRGLMIDVSRHFIPLDILKRNLDAMAAVKMNVFHWHLSEDQGFRIESKNFPKLHQLGSDGLYYTQDQVKDIIKYASERGIRVIPEFDIPGHATSWFVGYPEFASAPGPYKIERNWGIFDPTFNPAIKATYEFFDKFFEEMTVLFPDEYFHIGGDENNGNHWNENESIQAFMNENDIADNHELQAYFNTRIQKILNKYGKKMIGWDEILHEDIPQSIVIQSWRGPEFLIKASQQGYKGILSNGYYIDLMQPTHFHYLNDPLIKNSNLTEEEIERILGGEATMWSEVVSVENIESRIWPRTAAIAERLWSQPEINDVADMYRRLDRISFLLEEHGLNHIKFQQMMLRRLTNNQPTKSLEILVNVIEPLKAYDRHKFARLDGFRYQQHSPYSRVIDGCIADPKSARVFNNFVDQFILSDDASMISSIKAELIILKENHKNLKPVIDRSPVLKEIENLSMNLSMISETGLEALEFIESGKNANEEWIKKSEIIISDARKSYGQVEIVIVDAIQKLMEKSK